MKRIVITYGLISGTIVAAMMFITMPMLNNGTINFDNGEFIGYTSMVISLSLIFFGVKTYRDKQGNGAITFGQGVKVGLMISVIAAVMYALSWEVLYSGFYPDFMTKMSEHHMADLKASGASATTIDEAEGNMALMMEYYKNPIIRFGITIMEILWVGIVITLISSALLRRKEFLPATEPA
jgi:ethanolamine transporter EutH